MDLQSNLTSETLILKPLESTDFEALYLVASNPEIWEQHPNPDRYKRDVFFTFFEGAMQSKGAYKIIDKATNKIIGSTRFYDFNPTEKSVLIGYTFYAKEYWGTGVNHIVKRLMINYAFQFVNDVIFHIGAQNIRSQISIERLGATKIDEQEVVYFGEAFKLNYVYKLSKK